MAKSSKEHFRGKFEAVLQVAVGDEMLASSFGSFRGLPDITVPPVLNYFALFK